MAGSNDSRPGPCEQALIKKAADRAVEFLEFMSGTEGLAVAKNGRTVTITYTPPDDGGGDPGDIGIEDVDGLSAALAGKSATSHTHPTSEVTGLDAALAGKAATSHSHATSDVTGLDAALAGKASTSHSHATSDVTGLDAALAGKAAASHTHATSEVTGLDAALAGKAAASHDHNASAINAGTIDAARLPVAGTTTIGGVKRNTGSAGQYLLGFASDGAALYGTPESGYRPGRNYLINGDFLIAQNPNTTPTDGSYALDRWYALRGNTTGTLSYERYSALALGDPERAAVLRMQLSTADYKYGVAQIVESINCADLINQQVTLSFWAKGNGNTTAKAGIVSWSGPADTVTRDIVSSWGSDLTTPTLIANATFENTPAAIALTSTWSHHEVTATIDTPGATNVIVFLWIDDSTNNQLYLDRVQLEIGAAATPFERIPIADQLARCQRYYEVLRYNTLGQAGVATSPYNQMTWYFKASKRALPTVSKITGTWNVATPLFYPALESVALSGSGSFYATGTAGEVALAADAEL